MSFIVSMKSIKKKKKLPFSTKYKKILNWNNNFDIIVLMKVNEKNNYKKNVFNR